jgi:hypothetical protein
MWNTFKKLIGIEVQHQSRGDSVDVDAGSATAEVPNPELNWIAADSNPWEIPVLDVRPVTHSILSSSKDPQCAANAISYGQDDGTAFIDQEPVSAQIIPSDLTYPISGQLHDGVLFLPQQMEHKWAIFYRNGEVIVVRGWLRRVYLAARTEQQGNLLRILEIRGTFGTENETPDFTSRTLDFLLRTHALNLPYPAPLPPGMESDDQAAAMWCFSMFGNMVACATPHAISEHPVTVPLRSHSLLHIAVAHGSRLKVEAALKSGIPVDSLASDGMTPLQWALVRFDTAIIDLLLANGASIDARSGEGATALMNASQAKNLPGVVYLLSRGAEVDARDMRGFTALHRAAEMGSLDIAKALLEAGASPLTEAQGHTPRSLAEMRGWSEMAQMLQSDSFK